MISTCAANSGLSPLAPRNISIAIQDDVQELTMNELECVAGGSLTWVGVAVGVAVVAVVVGVVVYNYPRPPRTGVPGPSA
ncbi:MAG: hypothetical protein ACK56F_07070, partial [bacterium]